MGILDEFIKAQIMPPKESAAGAERVAKEREAVLNEIGTIDNLAKSFANIQQQGTAPEKFFGQGRRAGLIGKITGPMTGMNPAIEPYEGQRNYAAGALARIANPSGRGGAQLMDYYSKTLPQANSNWQEFANHIVNGINDAFVKKAALEGTPYSDIDPQGLAMSVLHRHMPKEEFLKFVNSMQQPSGPLPGIQFQGK